MIRAFVALEMPAPVRARLAAVQARLPAGRAVEPEGLHLTLAFLGEQQEPVVEDLHHALDAISAAPVPVAIEGLGSFGEGWPRVVHAAVRGDAALSALRTRVRTEAEHCGIRLERKRFRPHVTLARFSRPPAPEEAAALDGFLAAHAGLRVAPFLAEAFHLYRSRLGKGGASYEILASYPLG